VVTRGPGSGRALRWLALALAVIGLAYALYRLDPFDLRGTRILSQALTQRGRVAVYGAAELAALDVPGTQLFPVQSGTALERALAGTASDAVVGALARERMGTLLVEATPLATGNAVRDRLARYERAPGLRALFLTSGAVLYEPDPVQSLPAAQREATAVIARALVGGARPPKLASFPEALRSVRPCEVMVLLRRQGRARLWRSARGSSIATALLTAAVVARQRWQERERAMGGPIDELLPSLEVEVGLLVEDGTLGERSPAFIDRVFQPGHGVAYERKGAWRYLLPDATDLAAKGKPSRAYRKLFVDDGLPEDSFARRELRLYRLVFETLATSLPEPRKDDGLAPVRAPGEVLGP
jgi:hypothetical protein